MIYYMGSWTRVEAEGLDILLNLTASDLIAEDTSSRMTTY